MSINNSKEVRKSKKTKHVFNEGSRGSNILKTSSIGAFSTISITLISFVYRTVFIYILSANYLGIEGLFSNILKLLSMAELGITTAIVYRFYKPISENDIEKVGQLMRFFKRVYGLIALTITTVGLSILPFLNYLIKDISEVPADINIYITYLLYLLMQVSTYLFSYKLTILTADQKQYIVSLFNVAVKTLTCVAQIIILIIWKNFVLSLAINIVTTLTLNILMSIYVEKQYKEVFKIKTMLPVDERKQIYKDTFATLCHKVGGIIANGTDSIIISSFIGITVAGIYSNYHMIIYSLITIMQQVTGNFTASLGNAAVEKTGREQFEDFKKLFFVTLWISSYITTCVYLLIDKFILAWTNNENMVLDRFTVVTITFMLFIEIIRYIMHSYINCNGLFIKDKIRPLIEALINLVVSIILVQKIGLAGVFIGTIISKLLTCTWREPYLVFKNVFKVRLRNYWKMLFSFLFVSIITGKLIKKVTLMPIFVYKTTLFTWLIEAVIYSIIINLVLVLVFGRTKEFKFFKSKITKITNKLIRQVNTKESIE